MQRAAARQGAGLYSPQHPHNRESAGGFMPVDVAGDQSVTVKGSPVRSLQKFIEGELTPAQRDTLFGSLPQDFARLKAPVLATETVPVSMLNRLTEEAASVKG